MVGWTAWVGLGHRPGLAELGCVSRAVDMYGKGVLVIDRSEAAQLAGQSRGAWEEGGRELVRSDSDDRLDVHGLVSVHGTGRRPPKKCCADRRPEDCHRLLMAEWLPERGWEAVHLR